jgi:hypothetical protein
VNERWYKAFNLLLIALLTVVLINIQSVLWFHLFGEFTAPRMWLIVLTYLALRRRFWESVGGLYVLSLLLASHSLAPWGLVFMVSLVVVVTLQAIKDRIYVESTAYFTTMALLSVTLFNLYHLLVSSLYDTNPIHGPDPLRWITQSLTTAGFAPLILTILEWIDSVTKRDTLADSSGGASL